MLFNIPLSGNFDASPNSDDTYYDKECLSSSPTGLTKTKGPSVSSSPTRSTTVVKIPMTVSSTISTVTTTTSQTSQSAVSSPTTSAVSTVTVPSGCPAPASVELTDLSWFNSTHNLDCPNPNYPSGAEVCFDSTHVCANATDGVAGGSDVCSCVPYCYVGLPAYAYQP